MTLRFGARRNRAGGSANDPGRYQLPGQLLDVATRRLGRADQLTHIRARNLPGGSRLSSSPGSEQRLHPLGSHGSTALRTSPGRAQCAARARPLRIAASTPSGEVPTISITRYVLLLIHIPLHPAIGSPDGPRLKDSPGPPRGGGAFDIHPAGPVRPAGSTTVPRPPARS